MRIRRCVIKNTNKLYKRIYLEKNLQNTSIKWNIKTSTWKQTKNQILSHCLQNNPYFSSASSVLSSCKPDSKADEESPSKLVKCISGLDDSDISLLSSVFMSINLKMQNNYIVIHVRFAVLIPIHRC